MPGCFLRGVDQVVQICARAQANRAVLRNTVNDLMKVRAWGGVCVRGRSGVCGGWGGGDGGHAHLAIYSRRIGRVLQARWVGSSPPRLTTLLHPRQLHPHHTLQALYQAELSALRHAGLKGSAEYRYARARVAWALSAFPEVIVDWVRHVHGGLIGDDFARFVWTSYWWRRSAMEFLASVAASAPGLCPSVPARLQAELRNLDATIAAIERRLGARELSTCAPAGLPQSHWWFHLGCAAAEV